MTEQSVNLSVRDIFVRQLMDIMDETFEKVHGIYLDRGTSLFETLATITAEEASVPVSATCATLAAQVEHVNFYLNVLEQVMRNQNPGKQDWDYIWRTVTAVTPEQWEASKSKLKESYERLVAFMRSFNTWQGENDIAGALAVVVHTAYHLGEIRQALCTLRQA